MINEQKKTEARELFEKCAPLFIALGDTVRHRLLLEIVDAGAEGLNVSDLTATTNLSRPAVSHHLKVLKDAGFVKPIKKGTQVFYRIDVKDKIGMIKNLVSSIEEIVNEI